MRHSRTLGAVVIGLLALAVSGGCLDAVREGTTAGISAATETIIENAIEGFFDRSEEGE